MVIKKKYKKKPNGKNDTGKPTVMTESTLKILREGFSNSLTDEECCLYANISPQTLYNYCKQNPDFLEYKETLKKNPIIKAKMNKVKAIEKGNLQESGRRLERKAKDEFSTKTDNETQLSGTIEIKRAE